MKKRGKTISGQAADAVSLRTYFLTEASIVPSCKK